MSEIGSAAPRQDAMTLEQFYEKRGYDPKKKRYSKDEAPDYSGAQLHKLSL